MKHQKRNSIVYPPRRVRLQLAAKSVSLRMLQELLENGDTDALGRAVLRAEIAIRKRYGCN